MGKWNGMRKQVLVRTNALCIARERTSLSKPSEASALMLFEYLSKSDIAI